MSKQSKPRSRAKKGNSKTYRLSWRKVQDQKLDEIYDVLSSVAHCLDKLSGHLNPKDDGQLFDELWDSNLVYPYPKERRQA